jgi:hypothetical protein
VVRGQPSPETGFAQKERKGVAHRGKTQWTTAQLMAALRRAAVDGHVTAGMYDRLYEARKGTDSPVPSPQTFCIRYDTWNAAVEAAGLTHGSATREYTRLSREQLAGHVAVVIRALGHLPSTREYIAWRLAHPEVGLACWATVQRTIGNWPAALALAVASSESKRTETV